MKVQWTFTGTKISCEFAYTVRQQITLDKFRYVLAIAAPHSKYRVAGALALGPQGHRCSVARDDFQATWQDTEVVSADPTYRTNYGKIHYLQYLVRDHPLIMRPGQVYRLAVNFEPGRHPRRRSGSRRALPPHHSLPGRDRRAAWSRASSSRSCATPATRSNAPGPTTPRAPTSWSFSTSPPRATAGGSCTTSSAATAEQCFMPLTVGGGLRSVGDIEAMLKAGADKVSLNTAAIHDPELIRAASDRFGAQCIVLAIDAKREPGPGARWRVYTHGGRRPTELGRGRLGPRGAWRWAPGEILLTSMDRDGTQAGYDLELTRAISDAVEVPVIASGGAGSLEHFAEVLAEGRASAVLAASLFHFGTFTIPQVKDYLASRGVPVRR